MAFLLVGATLYLLFRRVDRRASGAPVVFAAVGSGLILVNLLFHHAALLVEPDPSSRSLGAQPYGGLMSLLLDMHDRGYTLAGIVLGLSLLPLGCLAYQSNMLPRVISSLLVVGLVVSTLVGFVRPDLPAIIPKAIAPPPVADFWLVLYLVAKAGRVPRRPDQLTKSAP